MFLIKKPHFCFSQYSLCLLPVTCQVTQQNIGALQQQGSECSADRLRGFRGASQEGSVSPGVAEGCGIPKAELCKSDEADRGVLAGAGAGKNKCML